MAYASQLGRARINASNPEAAGQCDRCGLVYSFRDLRWQYDWRGAALANIRILVCCDCYDVPQSQLRSIVLPADPTPIINARVVDWAQAETDFQMISAPLVVDPITGIPIPGTTALVTQDGQNLTNQPLGVPNDLDENAIMPLVGTQHYGVRLSPLSISSNRTDQITVTFGAPHGLATNAQIMVQGLTDRNACGAYSITVTTATAFTYQTNDVIAAAALLTPTTLMLTALVGLPIGYNQIPQVGGFGVLDGQSGPVTGSGILLESGFFLLLESGGFLLQG